MKIMVGLDKTSSSFKDLSIVCCHFGVVINRKWSKQLGKCVWVFSEGVRMQQPLLGFGIITPVLIIPHGPSPCIPKDCSSPSLFLTHPELPSPFPVGGFHHWGFELGLQPELSSIIFYFPLWVMRKVHNSLEFLGFPCSSLLGQWFNNLDCAGVREAWWQHGFILWNFPWDIFFLANAWTRNHSVFVSTLLGELWAAPDVFLEEISKSHW